MSELSLPPVAKSFYAFCKKCDADRYHKVLAHTTARTAKIECEVCHSKKSYTLPKVGGKPATAKAGAKTGTSTRRSHTGDYEIRSQKNQSVAAKDYSMKSKFEENQKISHTKFGLGFVLKSYDEKIDVIFSDEVKTLMHNRT